MNKPELFEACRQMRREYGAFGKVSQETLMQVDAAIAKATPVDRQKANTDTAVDEQHKEESRSRAAMEAEDPDAEEVKHELEIWLCPVHESLDIARLLKPLDNCVACMRVERDELRESKRELLAALTECDKAFAAWQLGQIPGRPEDILALIAKVRRAIAAIAAAHYARYQAETGKAAAW